MISGEVQANALAVFVSAEGPAQLPLANHLKPAVEFQATGFFTFSLCCARSQ